MRVGSHVYKNALLLWMEDKGVTQNEIADMCGVSQSLVVKWLSGQSQSMKKECFDILEGHLKNYMSSDVKDTVKKSNQDMNQLDSTIPRMIKRYFESKNISPAEAMTKHNLTLQTLAVIFDGKNEGVLSKEELSDMRDFILEVWMDLFKEL